MRPAGVCLRPAVRENGPCPIALMSGGSLTGTGLPGYGRCNRPLVRLPSRRASRRLPTCNRRPRSTSCIPAAEAPPDCHGAGLNVRRPPDVGAYRISGDAYAAHRSRRFRAWSAASTTARKLEWWGASSGTFDASGALATQSHGNRARKSMNRPPQRAFSHRGLTLYHGTRFRLADRTGVRDGTDHW